MYLPEKCMFNSEFPSSLNTNDEWIRTRSGIIKRHLISDSQSTSDMAYEASIQALESADIDPCQINLIIVATTTPDTIMPSCASILQKKISCTNAFAFDISAACSGFIYAMSIAHAFISSGTVKNALIVGAEAMSKIVDWNDRSTCVLFGDGAGAVVMSKSQDPNIGIIGCDLHSDGTLSDILYTKGGIFDHSQKMSICMDGRKVFILAIDKMVSSAKSLLSQHDITIDDIDLFVPHQANVRIINSVANKLKIPKEKILTTVHQHANTSAASIPMALKIAEQQGILHQGAVIMLSAFGAGLTWGSMLMRW